MHRLSLLLFVFLSLVPRVNAGFVYSQNFDGLTVGQTQPFPGAPGQGGWYSVLAESGGFGEIQNAIANSGQALHQFAAATTPANLQTIDRIELGSINVNHLPWVSLSFDFLVRTSNLDAVNSFQAAILAGGGPHPGFEIIGAGIGAGNGTAKRETGLNLSLATFNGLDNNEAIPLVVGQGLDFDAWHSVSIIIDQSRDRYVSIAVNGVTQDLSSYLLPRSFDQGQALRGHLIEYLSTAIVPSDVGGDRTDDSIYWDNIRLTAVVPEPSSLISAALGLVALAGYSGWRRARTRRR